MTTNRFFVQWIRVSGIALSALGMAVPCPVAAAQNPLLGEWPGYTRSFQYPLVTHAGYFYLGGLMHIFDANLPSNPVRVGGMESASARDIVIDANRAFLAAGADGIKIYDLSNPLTPVLVGALDTSGEAQGIAVVGNLVYVADYDGGFLIVDVSDPANPSLIRTVPGVDYASDVAVSGNYAFVADDFTGLRVVDISNPAAAAVVATLNTPTGYSYCVAHSGGLVYLGGEDDDEDEEVYPSLHIIDVSNPVAPVLAGTDNEMQVIKDIAISGNHIYVAGDGRLSGGLMVFDVSNPANPVVTVAPPNVRNQERILLANNHAFTAEPGFGLRIYTASPTSMQPVGGFEFVGFGNDVVVSGIHAYVADDRAGLRIIDISNPAVPVEVGRYNDQSAFKSVAVSGTFAYVVGSGGFRVINVSNPANPTFAGSLPMLFPRRIAVAGNLAFVAEEAAGLRIVNISNPASPTFVGTNDTPGLALGVTAAGNTVYVADWTAGVQIIDVSNPASPTLIGNYNTPDAAYDVAVSGNLLYVADGNSGLRVLDITNPAVPVSLGFLDTPGTATGIDTGSVFLATQGAGVRAIDVTDPANPIEVNSYQTLGSAENLVVSGQQVFVAAGARGLNIFDKEKLEGGGVPVFTLSIDDPHVQEGNQGDTVLQFTVTLSGAHTLPVSVQFVTRAGTAAAGADYTDASGIVTFQPGDIVEIVQVTVHGDVAGEADETVFLDLSNPVNATLAKASGTGTIVDDDPPVTVRVDDASRREGDLGDTMLAIFEVVLSRAVAVPVTVKYQTADLTATAGVDYTAAVDRSLTFPPGSTENQIIILLHGELLMEEDETFSVTLYDPVDAQLGDAQAVGTILNDDHYPQFLPMTSGSSTDILDVWGDSPENVWAVGNGGLLLHFNGNPSNHWETVPSSTGENLHTIHGTAANNVVVLGGDLVLQGGVLLRYNGANWSFLPHPGYTVRDIWAAPSGEFIAVGANFQIPNPHAVTRFGGGTWSAMWFNPTSAQTFGAAIAGFADDDVFAGHGGADAHVYHYDGNSVASLGGGETGRWDPVLITGSGVTWLGSITNPAPPHHLLIVDTSLQGTGFQVRTWDNGVLTQVPFVPNPISVVENPMEAWGGSISNLHLAGYSDQDAAQIGYFDGTKWTTAILPNGGGLPRLNAIWGVGSNDVFAVGNAGTILRVHNPRVSVDSIALPEGDSGTTTATFTVTLSPSNPFQTVTVQYATRAGTATAGTDYLGTSGSLSFAPGETNKTVQVTVNGDTVQEPNETLYLDLSNPVNAALGFNQGIATIVNDDGLPELSVSNVSIGEGTLPPARHASFTVTLSEPSTTPVRFNYRTVEGTAVDDDPLIGGWDYYKLTGSVTMSPGTTTENILVLIRFDADEEPDETFQLQLFNVENAALVGDGVGTCTILNDDGVINFRPELAVPVDQFVPEGESITVSATVTDQNPGDTHTFSVEGPPGLTINPQSGAITFAPTEDQGSGSYTVTVTVTDSGSPPQSASGSFTVTVIETNESPGITAIPDATIPPDAAFQHQVVANDPDLPVQPLTYSLENAPSGLAISPSGLISWTPSPSQIGAHTFTVMVSDGVATTSETVTLTVNHPPVLDAIPNQVGAQGGELSFFVVATDPDVPNSDVLRYSLGPDAPPGASIHEQSGDLIWTIDTSTPLGDHSFTVIVTDSFGATDTQNLTVTVRRGLSINSPSILEGNWGKDTGEIIRDLEFTVTLSHPSDQTVTVEYELIAGTAVPGHNAFMVQNNAGDADAPDYAPDLNKPIPRVTFAPGQTVQKFTVTIIGDNRLETDETFTAQLRNSQNAAIVQGIGTGTIRNDDGPQPIIQLPGAVTATVGLGLRFRVSAIPGSGSPGSSVEVTAILPDGFTHDPSTGEVSGTPGSENEPLNFFFTARDQNNGETTVASFLVPVNPPIRIRLDPPAVGGQGTGITIDGLPPVFGDSQFRLERTPQLDSGQPDFGFVPRSAVGSSAGSSHIFQDGVPAGNAFFRVASARSISYSGSQLSLRSMVAAPDGRDVSALNPRFRIRWRAGEPFQEYPAQASGAPHHRGDMRWTITGTVTVPNGIADDHLISFETTYDGWHSAPRDVTIRRTSNVVLIPEMTPIPNLPFSIGLVPFQTFDTGDDPGAVQIDVRSDNPSRFNALTIDGQGASRTLNVIQNPNVRGNARITIRVAPPAGVSSFQTFNLSEPAAVQDFNGDGKDDAIGQLPNGTVGGISLGDTATAFAFSPSFGGSGVRVCAADLDGDGHHEVVVQNADGELSARRINNLSTVEVVPLNPSNFGNSRMLVLAADFDGDGKSDLLTQQSDGTHHVWTMDGVNRIAETQIRVFSEGDPSWHCVAAGDVNLDGDTDLIRQHEDGKVVIQFLRAFETVGVQALSQTATFDPHWRVVRVVDHNLDGFPDLAIQHDGGALGKIDGRTGAASEIPWPGRPEDPANVLRLGVPAH